MAEEGSGARVVRNTLVNGGAGVAGTAVFLLLTPFMIAQMGADEYGVFTLAISLSFLGGYASLTDLGVEAATARYVAEARADGDVHGVNRVASCTAVFFTGAALVVAPVLAALAPVFAGLFDVGDDLRGPATWTFVLVAVQLLFEMPARTYFAVLEGSQRFTSFQACEMVRVVLLAGMYLAALIADLGVVAFGGAMAIASLVVLVLARALARRAVPDLHLAPSLVTRDQLRTLLGYGGSILVLRFTGTLYRQMDRVIVGIALGTAAVTVYEIANKIQAAAQMVQSVAASALVPATAFARAQVAVVQDLFLRGTAYTLAVSLPLVGVVLIFAEPLIVTWIEPEYADAAGPTRLFAIYLLMASFLVVGATMATALGHVGFLLAVNVPAVLLNVVLSVLLVGPLDISGVVLGSVISYAIAVPIQLRFFLRRFGVTTAQWTRRVILPQLPGAALQAATAPVLLAIADATGNLAVVLVLCLVSVGMSFAGFVGLGLGGDHRQALLTTLRDALGLPRPPTHAEPS